MIRHFATPAAFRAWLEKHYATRTELWVAYWKKATGKRSLTWSESVDEALCFGWIDGVRHPIDELAYKIRFTPRKARSAWSAINLGKMKALEAEGRMTEAGRRAFHASDHRKSGYAVRNFKKEFDAAELRAFKRERQAWTFFLKQPPGYRRIATWWVMNAKQPATRARRLARLIADSAAGQRLGRLSPAGSKPARPG